MGNHLCKGRHEQQQAIQGDCVCTISLLLYALTCLAWSSGMEYLDRNDVMIGNRAVMRGEM